jgi:16S rRNA (adenine1518-N6/adenine1519-N6)-dimethyltransferase
VGHPVDLQPLDIPELIKKFGLRLKKSLGQNYLIDSGALRRIIKAAEISKDEDVLEIGPGLGSLTRLLAAGARRVVAVEIDGAMLPPLRKILNSFDNVRIVEGDILDFDPAQLMEVSGYLVVANIPYYITSAIVRHLVEASTKPSRMILTVQREVAQRICAGPGGMSLLSLSVQVYGEPSIIARVPAGSFYPAPKVDSAVVRIDLFEQPVLPVDRIPLLFDLAKTAFAQKRKKLRNSLRALPGKDALETDALLIAAEIDPARRPESLSLSEWKQLVEAHCSAISSHSVATT